MSNPTLEERLTWLQETMAIHASGELLSGETKERVAMWNGYADTCRDALVEIARLKGRIGLLDTMAGANLATAFIKLRAAESREARLREVMLRIAGACEGNASHGNAWTSIGQQLREALTTIPELT